MITHQDQIIQNLFKQVNGMEKIEVYDILLKIETMLVYINPKVVHLLLEKYTISLVSKYKYFTLIINDKHVYKTRNNIT
ncbi:hypothetical protein ACSTS3_21595 [Aquimarina muelleri]|uniref:hypothetical protein n=1 Tax=Aquimarina muelleri TaxID=279356 RepID=UPI003F6880E5